MFSDLCYTGKCLDSGFVDRSTFFVAGVQKCALEPHMLLEAETPLAQKTHPSSKPTV